MVEDVILGLALVLLALGLWWTRNAKRRPSEGQLIEERERRELAIDRKGEPVGEPIEPEGPDDPAP
jgi:hypothetical protein